MVKVCLICAFIGGSGVGYVWQKNQIFELGRQIKQCELRLDELRRQNKQKADALAYLRSPKVLDARVKELKLNLAPPEPKQILRLNEWAPARVSPAENNSQFARRGEPALARAERF
jgi:hypothetical protein